MSIRIITPPTCAENLTTEQQLRLSLVEGLMPRLNQTGDGAEIVALVHTLADFILGTNDAEILRAARDLAQKVNG